MPIWILQSFRFHYDLQLWPASEQACALSVKTAECALAQTRSDAAEAEALASLQKLSRKDERIRVLEAALEEAQSRAMVGMNHAEAESTSRLVSAERALRERSSGHRR